MEQLFFQNEHSLAGIGMLTEIVLGSDSVKIVQHIPPQDGVPFEFTILGLIPILGLNIRLSFMDSNIILVTHMYLIN